MTRSSLLNKRLLVLAGGIAFLLALLMPLNAFEIELKNISDNNLTSDIKFKQIKVDANAATAKQYLTIEYPEVISQTLQLYTDNKSWEGAAGERPGLVAHSSNKNSLPLYWISFPEVQPNGVTFSSSNITGWNKVLDLNDSPSSQLTSHIPKTPGQVNYIYFATILPLNPLIDDYSTKLTIDLLSPFADVEAPVVSGLDCSQMPHVNPMKFETVITDDFNVALATFNYRKKGETNFLSRPMSLARQSDNPLKWKAAVPFSNGELSMENYEYYINAEDGYTRSFLGNKEAPLPFQVVDEFAEFSQNIKAAGASKMADPCARAGGAPDIVFPPGSLSRDTQITMKKVASQSMVAPDGKAAVSAFQFGPKGLQFNRPVTLIFRFPDADQDGIVDGTSIPEKDLKIAWLDGSDLVSMGGRVDSVLNTVEAEIWHFSIYGLFPGGSLPANSVRPKQTILTPNGDQQNDSAQFGISGEFEISIYNVQGKRIRKLSNINIWDGRMDDGGLAVTGAYIYQVHSSQLDKPMSGTIAVAY